MTYVLYKVSKQQGANDNLMRMMSEDDLPTLRKKANAFFADPDEFIGREGKQLIIPSGELQSNIVTTVAGAIEYHRYVEIREIGKQGE